MTKGITSKIVTIISDNKSNPSTIDSGEFQIHYHRPYGSEFEIKFDTNRDLLFKCKSVIYPIAELPNIISALKGDSEILRKKVQLITKSGIVPNSKSKGILLKESGDFYISTSKRAYLKSEHILKSEVIPLHDVTYVVKSSSYSGRSLYILHLNRKDLDLQKGESVLELITYLETLNSIANEYIKIKK